MASSAFNLLKEAWLPVRRLSRQTSWIRPAELTGEAGDIVVDFAWGRPDFDATSREWMIGLLFSAHAGMNRQKVAAATRRHCVLRTRGDEPIHEARIVHVDKCSPHTRA